MPASPPRYAVFGHPIAHSLSPRLHALFAEQAAVELQYTAIDAPPAAFARAVKDFFATGGCGANVTVPHKAAAFALANVHTPTALRLGVANVLTLLPDGRIEADSNDGVGLLRDLERRGFHPRGRDVLLLGAGGAARATAFALLDAGVARLVIANRTRAHADALVADLGAPSRVEARAWNCLPESARPDLLVNATSAGVHHQELTLPASLAGPGTIAYDLGYGASATHFVDWARKGGCTVAFDGYGMLVETAAASFARWHGVRPDTNPAMGTPPA